MKFHLHPDVLVGNFRSELVFVHVKTDRILSLNATATRCYQLIAEGRDLAEIQKVLISEFDVDPAAVQREIDGLISALTHERLIVNAD